MLGKYLFLGVIIATMMLYQSFILTTKGIMDESGHMINPPSDKDKLQGTIASFIYSMLVVVFGLTYKKLAYK
jgi:hypothetical protein